MDHKTSLWIKGLLLIALLALTLAAMSCKKQETPAAPETETEAAETETEAPSSVRELALYWNVDYLTYAHQSETGLSSRTVDKTDGYYHFLMAGTDNRQVDRRVKDAQIKNYMDEYRLLVLTLDENRIVVGAKNAEEATGGYYAKDFFVEKVEDHVVTAWSTMDMNGKKATIDLTGVKIFDCSDRAYTTGELATEEALDPTSRIMTVLDFDGTPAYLYIISRPKPQPKLEDHHVCPECGENLQWWGWNRETELPTESGHYFLKNDVKLKAQLAIPEGQHIVICLNGYTITGTGKRTIALFNPGAALDICDCSEDHTGAIVSDYSKGDAGGTQGAVVWVRYGRFRLYSGTLDGHKVMSTAGGGTVCANGGTSFEMYGGKIIGGTSYYGSAVRITGSADFTMTGGEIVGGNSIRREEADALEIQAGKGAIRMTGGSVSGGVYLAARDNVVVGGTLQVTGAPNGLLILADKKITLEPFSEGASIRVSLENVAGVFTKNYVEGAENVFRPDDDTVSLTRSGNALELVEKNPHVHCDCGTGTVAEGGHVHKTVRYTPWTKKDSLPTESGHYYLKNDVVLKGSFGTKNGAEVHLCLNGHNITQSAVSPNPSTGNVVNPRVISLVAGTSAATKCVFTNCSASGGRISRSNTNSYNGQGAVMWTGPKNPAGNTIELYNITVDGRNFNTSSGTGGIICVQDATATLKAWNVKILGGQTAGNGGAIAITGGTAEFYHSAITGGTAGKNGGAISMTAGKLLLSDTTVTSGTAANGKNVFLGSGTLTVTGNTKADEIYVSTGKKITIENLGANASIGVFTEAEDEPFANGLTEDLSARFHGTAEGQEVVFDAGAGTLSIHDPNAVAEEHKHCVCGTGTVTAGGHVHAEADWTAWKQDTSLPTGTSGQAKYYFLTKDVTIGTQISIEENATVYLCLNGHKITGTMNGRMFALMNHKAKLVITNCGEKDAEHGVLVKTEATRTYDNEGGIFWIRYADDELALYNVTLDGGPHKNAKTGGLIFLAAGTLTAVNTIFKGGTTTGVQASGATVNADGGALSIRGTAALYHSEIQGGISAGNGGSIAVNGGTLTLTDTKISGGQAAGKGNGVYVNGGSVTLTGNTIADEIYLETGNALTLRNLGESASLGVKLAEEKGLFAEYVETDLSARFTALGSGLTVKYGNESLYVLGTDEAIPEEGEQHKHCICGTGTVNLGAHTAHDAEQVWKPWTSDNSLPTEDGYYYLTTDVTARTDKVQTARNIAICLNGYSIKNSGNSRTVDLQGAGSDSGIRYVFTNCGAKNLAENKGVIYSSSTGKYTYDGGMLYVKDATLELYNVIVDPKSHKVGSNGGNAVFTTGAKVYAYGTTFLGGAADKSGGALYVRNNAEVLLANVTVSGGSAGEQAPNVYMMGTGLLRLAGTVQADEILFADGKQLRGDSSLSSASNVGVRMEAGTGLFGTEIPSGAVAAFVPVDDGLRVAYNDADQTVSLETTGTDPTEDPSEDPTESTEDPTPVGHRHCICGTGTFSAGGHTHDSDVLWVEWTGNKLPGGPDESGNTHFYLTADVTLGAEGKITTAGQKIYLCLNGYNIRMTTASATRRILNLSQGEYVITNCGAKGNGHGTISSVFSQSDKTGGLFQMNGGTSIELYHLVADASTVTARYGAVCNMNTGTFRVYDSEILGGTAASEGGGSFYTVTNASLRVELYRTNVSGGKATGANGDGGNILMKAGTLYLENSTVSGGETARNGSDIYLTGSGTATLAGTVSAGIALAEGKTVTLSGLGAGSSIGIAFATEAGTGVFAKNVASDLSGCFHAPEGKSITYSAEGQTLSIE